MIATLTTALLAFTPPSEILNRRSIVSSAAAVAAATFLPKQAKAVDFLEVVSKYQAMEKNTNGDAAAYTPKAIVEAGGAKSTRLIMKMPDPGPLSQRDYIDAMWFVDSKGSVLGAGQFRADGKGVKEQVDGIKKAPVEPKFQARIDAGAGEVFPCVHSSKDYVWCGTKSVLVK